MSGKIATVDGYSFTFKTVKRYFKGVSPSCLFRLFLFVNKSSTKEKYEKSYHTKYIQAISTSIVTAIHVITAGDAARDISEIQVN